MTNVGGIDRIARILAGALLLVLTFAGPLAPALFPWGFLGFVPDFRAKNLLGLFLMPVLLTGFPRRVS